MAAKNHNFLRLWALDASYAYHLDGTLGRIGPNPFLRIGPGVAADSAPKFDLTQLDQNYFERLRSRTIAAGDKGIYVSIMLTNGIFTHNPNNFTYSIYRYPANNVNSDLSSLTNATQYTLTNSAWVELMDRYIDKTVDTVNDLDNVLFEVSNEANPGSSSWQDHVIDRIHSREAGKSKQHLIGKTSFTDNASDSAINADLLASKADWVSLAGRTRPNYTSNVIDAPANKVSILDTDHIYGFDIPPAERRPWVWKSLTRGHNPIYITPQTGYPGGFQHYPEVEETLGFARAVADRIDLAHMTPTDKITSTGYCLSSANEYLIYQPANSSFTVTLTTRSFSYEWISPTTGLTIESGRFTATAGDRTFDLPNGYDQALLHLKAVVPQVTAINRLPDRRVLVEYQGDPNVSYQVEVAPTLHSSFEVVATVTADASGVFSYEDGGAGRFLSKVYRIAVP
jgi:hypothetical protein